MVKVELSSNELRLLASIVLMHATGMIVPIHKDWRPLLNEVNEKLQPLAIRAWIDKSLEVSKKDEK